ncbi:MAG: hypothetical protein AAGJ79_06100 [Verrucomicrobiota bacterium]
MLVKNGVHREGFLEKEPIGQYVIPFDLDATADFSRSNQWKQPLQTWSSRVQTTMRRRAAPAKLWE